MARSSRGRRGTRTSSRLSGNVKREIEELEEATPASLNEKDLERETSEARNAEESEDVIRDEGNVVPGAEQKAELPTGSSRSERRQQTAGNSYEQFRATKMAQTASLLRILDLPVPMVKAARKEGSDSSDKDDVDSGNEEGGEEGSEPEDHQEEQDDKGDDDYDPGFEAFTNIDEDEEEEDENEEGEENEDGQGTGEEGETAGKKRGGGNKRRLKKGKRRSEGKLGFDSQEDWEDRNAGFDAAVMGGTSMSGRGDMDEDEMALQQVIAWQSHLQRGSQIMCSMT